MAAAIDSLLSRLGPEITDHEEEAFLLFSQSIPSHALGFIDPKSTTLELTINGQDLTITQSPGVLSSNRAGGTTGAGRSSPILSIHPPVMPLKDVWEKTSRGYQRS